MCSAKEPRNKDENKMGVVRDFLFCLVFCNGHDCNAKTKCGMGLKNKRSNVDVTRIFVFITSVRQHSTVSKHSFMFKDFIIFLNRLLLNALLD